MAKFEEKNAPALNESLSPLLSHPLLPPLVAASLQLCTAKFNVTEQLTEDYVSMYETKFFTVVKEILFLTLTACLL
jgi:hypothetical protein